jgi:hypothetical protein
MAVFYLIQNMLWHYQAAVSPVFNNSFFFKQTIKPNLSLFPNILAGAISVFFLLAVIIVFIRLWLIWRDIRQKNVQLEIKPPVKTLQSPFSTQQLFNLIHGLARQRPFIYKLFDCYKSYALEIVSSKKEGIRYLLRIPGDDADLVKKSLLAYLPGISINRVCDYLPAFKTGGYKITDFKQANYFAYPLKKQSVLKEHDPIAYITGSMTKLAENELVCFQLIASPANKRIIKQAGNITKMIADKKDLAVGLKNMTAAYKLINLFKLLAKLVLYLLTVPIGLLVFLASGGRQGPLMLVKKSGENKHADHAYQKELEKLIKGKLDQPLFKAGLRLLVVSSSRAKQNQYFRGFASALSSFSNSHYQALTSCFNFKSTLINQSRAFLFKNRLFNLTGSLVLSASEMADIYHLPFTASVQTEDLVKLHSRQLPAPLSLKKTSCFDVVFAKNIYGGKVTKIGLTKNERRRHMYILGATGTGKSTLLLSMIMQDIYNNKGLCVIDPHGDLIDNILPAIPESRLKDVIYFNPDDVSHPIGLNLLELTQGLSEDDILREKELVTESIISLFHKIYSERYTGPRMEYILRNTIHTAFITENPTLFTVYKLLINTAYRKQVIRGLTDENLKDFWRYEFAKAGDYQKVKMISPITNKIGRFLFSPPAKRILEQEKSSINFDRIMSEGKILLCNVSKGKIGEDSSEVFGILIMTKVQLAALKRARLKNTQRKDFYFYVDEFQNFATPAFAEILSEARKYRLNAIMAHQTTSQLEDKSLINITLANTGTVICFRTANPKDERLILPQFMPYVDKGEIASLPLFSFYMKISALNPQEPFSGITTPVRVGENMQKVKRIIGLSRKQYALKYKQEQVLKTRPAKKPKQPKQIKPAPTSILP